MQGWYMPNVTQLKKMTAMLILSNHVSDRDGDDKQTTSELKENFLFCSQYFRSLDCKRHGEMKRSWQKKEKNARPKLYNGLPLVFVMIRRVQSGRPKAAREAYYVCVKVERICYASRVF